MKGASMNFVIGLVIALFMFGILAAIITSTIFDAQGAAQGCGPISSLISDVSGGGIETC